MEAFGVFPTNHDAIILYYYYHKVSRPQILEEVSGWLRVYHDNSVDRSWTGPPEVEFLMKPVPSHEDFKDGVATRDVLIDPNTADWYMYYHFYAWLVRSVRAVCVSVYLRLAPEHRLPAACDDAYAAFLWLRDVARGEMSESWLNSYADFGRVFFVGDSTGGNIVHDLAARVTGLESEPVRLAGGVAIHPGFLRAEPSKSFLELADSKDHPITCPMGAEAPPLAGLKLPPMLVVVAEKDLLRDTELEYCEAMKEAGKEVEVMMNPGMGHSFYFNKLAIEADPETKAQAELLIETIKSFITRQRDIEGLSD
ncbi:unnamed protein product, partial [Vitis vinifera]